MVIRSASPPLGQNVEPAPSGLRGGPALLRPDAPRRTPATRHWETGIDDVMPRASGLTYAQAGVDIDAGNAMVDAIKPFVRATRRPGADAEIGGFGGLFDLKAAGFKDPILVAANDGVGTKVKIAIETGIHDTIGIDLVAMCVNDIIVQGAEPLLFLDYFATGKLAPKTGVAIVKGIAEGCQQRRMRAHRRRDRRNARPLRKGRLRSRRIRGRRGRARHAPAAGGRRRRRAHRPALFRACIRTAFRSSAASSPMPDFAGTRPQRPSRPAQTLGEALLEPTRIYVKPLLAALKAECRHQGARPYHRRRLSRQHPPRPAGWRRGPA